MLRFLRPWSKKRGTRLASRMFSGLIGEVLFFASLFLLGVFFVALTIAGHFNQPAPATTGPTFWVFTIASLVLAIIGGGGLAYRILRVGASNERRAAIAKRTGALEFGNPSERTPKPLPNVPLGTELNISPGIRLAYRLPSKGSPAVRVGAAALLALLWSGTWLVLCAVAMIGFWTGTPKPVLTMLLVPLGGISYWSAKYLLGQLREAAGVGMTIVEVSETPLQPGKSYRIYVAQYGNLRLRRLKIVLICEEEAIFRQGTDVRTDHHVSREIVICNEKNVSIDPGGVWEQESGMVVPASAMHSFQSSHNAVNWKIVVTGESRPWPSFCRSFPVVVHPPRAMESNHVPR